MNKNNITARAYWRRTGEWHTVMELGWKEGILHDCTIEMSDGNFRMFGPEVLDLLDIKVESNP